MQMRSAVIIGLAGGAIIGIVAGLMLAPRSGRATRNALKNRVGQLRYRVMNNWDIRRLDPSRLRR